MKWILYAICLGLLAACHQSSMPGKKVGLKSWVYLSLGLLFGVSALALDIWEK